MRRWRVSGSTMIRQACIPVLVVLAFLAAAGASLSFEPPGGPGEPEPGRAIAQPAESLLADLGRKLFFDVRLSRSGTTACATCHDPEHAFAQPLRVSVSDTGRTGRRNAPSLVNAALLPALMWDGRFRTLEEQASSPFQRGEMGIGIEEAVRRLTSDPQYRHLFRAALDERPSVNGTARALAAYQRTLISGESRFDRFLLGNETAVLSSLEQDGFHVFDRKAACTACHDLQPRANHAGSWLPLFTDFRFHNLGVGYRSGQFADAGRYEVTGAASDVGAFRTPSLRNVAVTAPYMHDGSLDTLDDVVDFYVAGGRRNPNLSPLLRPLLLDAYEKAALVAFLRALTDQRAGPKLTDEGPAATPWFTQAGAAPAPGEP